MRRASRREPLFLAGQLGLVASTSDASCAHRPPWIRSPTLRYGGGRVGER
jgi:hypothetical protein